MGDGKAREGRESGMGVERREWHEIGRGAKGREEREGESMGGQLK